MEELRPSQLIIILKELRKQTEFEQVMEQFNKWAFLASVIVNVMVNGFRGLAGAKGKSKVIKPEDFLSKRAKQIIKGLPSKPENKPDWGKHIKDAQDKGLHGPWEGGEK
jgi:hypothetical protein